MSYPTLSTREGTQRATLAGLAALGVDIAPAAALAGDELDAWIDAAEEAGFQQAHREFMEQRQALATTPALDV